LTLPDRIDVDATAGVAEGVFHVCEGADYLADHFPGAPMLPGLLMLEVGVRAAAALWSRSAVPPAGGAVLQFLDRLQVVRRVVPGETLVVQTRAADEAGDAGTAWFTALGHVDGQTAMRAKFRLRAVRG
jgi:3-hydroxyacyl-[acyl-carrier-protein] dehydratase